MTEGALKHSSICCSKIRKEVARDSNHIGVAYKSSLGAALTTTTTTMCKQFCKEKRKEKNKKGKKCTQSSLTYNLIET